MHAFLTPLQSRLFTLVQRAGADGIESATLADRLYADRPDGGPVTVRNIVCVTAKRIRNRLAGKFNVTVAATRGQGSRYYLIPVARLPEFEKRHERTYRRWKQKGKTLNVV